jgi:hypothetical protein
LIFLDCVRRNMSECRGRKDHEDKTSGSVLHGLVFAHECALLVNFRIHDTNKIPVGTLRNTGTHTLVSPKSGTRWVTPGPKFESEDLSL